MLRHDKAPTNNKFSCYELGHLTKYIDHQTGIVSKLLGTILGSVKNFLTPVLIFPHAEKFGSWFGEFGHLSVDTRTVNTRHGVLLRSLKVTQPADIGLFSVDY